MENLSGMSSSIPVFEKRISEVEKDTEEIYSRIAKLELSPDTQTLLSSRYKPIAPSRVSNGNSMEAPVARLCRLESSVQMLKATVTRIQAELDLSRKEITVVKEKEKAAKMTEQELSRLKFEHNQLTSHCSQLEEQKKQMEEKLSNLQMISNFQPTLSLEIDNLQATKQKLERRITELKDEVQREKSLRSSLEQSQQTLINRIQEIEENIEKERQQVKLNDDAGSSVKKDLMQAHEELVMERKQKEICEKQILTMQQQIDLLHKKVRESEEDNRLILNEAKKSEERNNTLLKQLDDMKHVAFELQDSYLKLEKDKSSLKSIVDDATARNTCIISKYEQQIESQRAQVIKTQLYEDQITSLTEKLKQEIRAKSQAIDSCGEVERKLLSVQEELKHKEEELKHLKTNCDEQINRLKGEQKLVESQRDQALRDKDTLMSELRKRSEQLGNEKDHVESQLAKAEVEIKGLGQTVQRLELENKQLVEKLLDMEQRQDGQSKMEKNLAELVEQKSRLAYDKGHLQSQVTQLQQEIESLVKQQGDLQKYKQSNTALEAKCAKVNSYQILKLNEQLQEELVDLRLSTQQSECQVKQWQVVGERKERDFELALQARDEALAEVRTLKEVLDSSEKQSKSKISGVEELLNIAHLEHQKLTDTLETVMASHRKLQDVTENLQQELGSKDCQLAQALKERSDLLRQLQYQQKESVKLEQKLAHLTTNEVAELLPLKQSLSKMQSEQKKAISLIEELRETNGKLQADIGVLKDELDKKKVIIQQLEQAREQDYCNHKGELKIYEKRLENLQQLLNKEHEKNIKQVSHDVAMIQQEFNESQAKNQELFRQNRDLIQRVNDLEREFKDAKKANSSLKAQLKNMTALNHKHKDTIDNFQVIQNQIAALEKAKNDYVQKYKRQSQTLEQLMHQLSLLQQELKALSEGHVKTSLLIQQQEEAIAKEKKNAEQWKAKYKTSREREMHLSQLLSDAEQKLLSTSEQSLQMNNSLQDAQDWFKAKFDYLQHEMKTYRNSKSELEKENREIQKMLSEERHQAKETAERAKAMLKASRETIARLGDFAELARRQTNSQIETMKYELEMERSQASLAQQKLHKLQETSLRYTEELAGELDTLRNQSTLFSSTNLTASSTFS